MSTVTYVLAIACALVGIVVVIELQRRQRLRERHAIWWMVAGLGALVLSVFPQLLEWAADVAGIEVPTNLVFFASIALLFGICLQLSSEATELETKTRTLAERVAILELRISELERTAPVEPASETDEEADRA